MILVKRFLDMVGSLFLLILTFPLLLAAAGLIRWKMGAPILYRQIRPGLNGKPFTLYKLRTMVELSNQHGQVLDDQQRLTTVGKLLRKCSLDELPQLVNVLKGEMSLVGPRPLLMEYLPLYTEAQAKRHMVKPGITGWAQVNGRNAISWEEKFEHDMWYVEHASMWLDFRILILTLVKVVKREGISREGMATTPKFKGSRGGELG